MSLKDFRPDPPDFDDDEPFAGEPAVSGAPMQDSTHFEEINTLKIDKLSNRVTIISIIIPCLIGVILVFGYLDIKERVTDVDITKQSQYEKISRQLEEKLNALDVKIAQNKYDLDNALPALEKKTTAIEGQMTKKADSKSLKGQVAKLEKNVKAMNNKTLATLKETQGRIDKTAEQMKKDIALFKEEFDARLLELSDYEQQIGELRKNFSLLDKKWRNTASETISKSQFDADTQQLKKEISGQIASLEKQLATVSQKLNANVSRFQRDIDLLMKSRTGTGSDTTGKPSPQINIDSSDSEPVKEEPLSQ